MLPTPLRGTTVRTTAVVLGLTVALGGGALAAPAGATSATATALDGPVALFPSDALTVRDDRQLTGRRVALPTGDCTTVTVCGLATRLNQLDGFDLDPRLALDFAGPVDLDHVVAATTLRRVGAPASEASIGIDRLVLDRATDTVYAHPVHQLQSGTTYRLRVSAGHGLPAASTTFTTLSATDGLLDLRRQLDSGTAYAKSGIDFRGLRVEASVPAQGTTFSYVQDRGAQGGLVTVPAASLASGRVVFGSYLAPSWLRADRTIEQLPTEQSGPAPVGAERLPFVLVLPAGTPPAGGWPTAVYGHGFTRSAGDVLLAAATNSAAGIATIGTTVAGHGYGPRSTWSYTRGGVTSTAPAHGRGVDLDANGTITNTEGSSTLATGAAAAIGSRDALRETAADVMSLVRAVESGSHARLRPSGVTYFGQSFGGIYGTMVAGADRHVARAVLNVAGGPVTEIVRLSPGFRPLLTQSLQVAGLLNSTDATKGYFQESMPLRGQRVTDPVPGALAIQDYLADSTWLTRPGSPETFAPRVRDARALFQVAYGDQTVPNPTSYTLLEAGRLFARASLYRNDLTASAAKNPHGFLLNPVEFPEGFRGGQAQVAAFLGTGITIDPDRGGDVWEVPVERPNVLRRLNFDAPQFR